MKRVISLLLAVVLCVGMLPTPAFAGTTADNTTVNNGDGVVPTGKSSYPFTPDTAVGWCLTVQQLGAVDISTFKSGDENNKALASSMLRDLSDYPKIEKASDYAHAVFVLPGGSSQTPRVVYAHKTAKEGIKVLSMSSSGPSTTAFAQRCEVVFNNILAATAGGKVPVSLPAISRDPSYNASVVAQMMGKNLRDNGPATTAPSKAFSDYLNSLTDTPNSQLTADVKKYVAQLVWAFTVECATLNPRESVLDGIESTMLNMFKGSGQAGLYAVSASVTSTSLCYWFTDGLTATTAVSGITAFFKGSLTDVSTAAFSPSKTDQLYVISHNMGNGGTAPLYGSVGAGTSAWPRGSTLGIDNVAGALVSSAAKIHVLLYNIFGFETGTLNNGSGDAKNASISYDGHTYGSNIGFFWYIDGLSGRFLPPPPTSDITSSERPGDLIRPAVKGGVKVVTPPLFTESSPVSAQVETEWSLNLDPTGMYLGEDGLFHEDGTPYTFKSFLSDMDRTIEIAGSADKNQQILNNLKAGIPSYVNPTIPAGYETVNQFELQDGDIYFTAWAYLKATTTMTTDEGGELISQSQGYWGTGSGPHAATSTYKYNTVRGYDPTTNALDLKARNPDNPPVLSIPVGNELASAFQSFFGDTVTTEVDNGGARVVIKVKGEKLDEFVKLMDDNNWVASVRITNEIQGIDVDLENEGTALTWAIVGWSAGFNRAPVLNTTTVNVSWQETAFDGSTVDGSAPTTTFYQVVERPVSAITFNDYKLDYHAVGGINPEHPTYHSVVDPYPHSEFNQGDVKQNATSPTRKFNSMTGTPTFTATEREELMESNYYGKDGHYYQYFAVGGSEFVVEFDGKFHSNETAKRTYTWNFASGGECDQNNGSYECGGHPVEGGGTTYCDDSCAHAVHCSDHPHIIGAVTTSFTVTYTGLSYVEIENAHVYQLVEGLLEGTYDLLDTDEVRAEIKSNAPGISVNIAEENTAEAGRLVYKYEPTQLDHVEYNYTLPGTCGGDGPFMKEKMDADVAKIEHGAYCVSDFIVLHTSAGNMSVLYHEYEDLKYSDPFSGSTSATSSAPGFGSVSGSASVTCNNANQGFEVLTYEEVWKSNPWTSEGAGFIPEGITYGGFNGKPLNLSTTYKSTHQNTINMSWSEWTKTQAYQNKSGVYGDRGDNSYLLKTQPSKSLRLMANGLVIPDYKQNGDYDFTRSQVFYEELVDFEKSGGDFPNVYSAATQSDFNNKSGFTMVAGYAQGSAYDNVANSVVVYNPISNQNAIVVSLPEERDQRTEAADVVQPLPEYGCPGITCEFSELVCNNLTGHLHGPGCYSVTERTVHGPANIHVHNLKDPETGVVLQECTKAPATCDCSHCGNPACPNYCSNHRYACSSTCGIANGGGGWYVTHGSGCSHAGERHYTTSRTTCTTCGHSCGGTYEAVEVWSCNNLPLNAHDCNATSAPSTPQDQTISKSISYAASGTDVYTFTAAGAGYVNFYSTSYNRDPRGRVYVNGTLKVDDDDGGDSLNFNTGNVNFNAGDSIRLNVYQYGSSGAGTANVTIVIHYNSAPSGGGGGGSYVPPGAQYGTWTSNSHYSSTSRTGYKCTLDGYEVVVCDDGYTYMFGSECGRSSTITQYGTSFPLASKYPGYSTIYDGSSSGHRGITWKFQSAYNTPQIKCYESTSVTLTCTDPHHTWDYDWHVYTTGRMHKSGKVCTGTGCTDTTDIVIFGGEYAKVSDLSNGMLVQHSNGEVHLTRQGSTRCDFCGQTFQVYRQTVQSTTRVLTEAEIAAETAHWPMGDVRCWQPCNDPKKHSEVPTEIVTPGGEVLIQGDFINLDYGFTIYYPNNGDFYQTGRKSSLDISTERGWGYVDNMDITEWVKAKWVIFPFDVVHNGNTYLAGEKIFLRVPQEYFDFYLPMSNNEMAAATVTFNSTAINSRSPYTTVETRANEVTNKRIIPPYSRPHDVDKRFNIDVVGRIGALTTNDVGDFRYSNFFKQTIDGWLVPNVIRKVDTSKQNNILIDDTDIRGWSYDEAFFPVDSGDYGTLTGDYTASDTELPSAMLNTHGVRAERLRNIWQHPLVPSVLADSANGVKPQKPGYYTGTAFTETPNNQAALQRQPVRIGYDSYMDFSTIGNYYGSFKDGYVVEGSREQATPLRVRPHYFRLRWEANGNVYLTPADVYMQVDGNYVLVNDFYDDTAVPLNKNTQVSMNFVEELARRNYDSTEKMMTETVSNTYGLELPRDTQWVYGTYNLLGLEGRNRTSIGTRRTYGVSTDPSERLYDSRYWLQGARWHFNLGLPSSSVFVETGTEPTDENIKNFAGDGSNAVIVVALEIIANGDVWNLIYDGKDINAPFKITSDGPTFNPNDWNTPDFNYPGREEDLVIAEIISINHSSKEDVNTVGTN